jgi:AcrR family transcriptional regulator
MEMNKTGTLTRTDTTRGEATRAAILQTAERLFRDIGYQKTTVADIARELGMSPANVYRFFTSKAAINEAICARLLDGLGELMWSIARGKGSPQERLQAIFRTSHQQTMQLFFHEKRMHDMVDAAMAEHWDVIETFIHAIETAIRHVIMDGQSQGVFAALPPDQTAKLVHCTMIGFSHPTLVSQCADEDLAAVAEGMADLVLRALRP